MFPSAAHMTSLFRTLLPRLMPAARLIIKKEYNDFFLFRHPTITFSIENQCMRAEEHQMLWSKEVLNGILIVLSRKHATFWPRPCSYNCMRGKNQYLERPILLQLLIFII